MPAIRPLLENIHPIKKAKKSEAVKPQSPSEQKATVKSLKRFTADELETKFLFDVAAVCNSSPVAKDVRYSIIGDVEEYKQGRDCPAKINILLSPVDDPKPIEQRMDKSAALVGHTSSRAPVQVAEQIPEFAHAATRKPKHSTRRATRILSIRDFEIFRLLSEGRRIECKTFLALDSKTDKLFALKVTPKESMTAEHYTMVFKEQALGKGLRDCPWAVGIEGSFEDSKNFYILMGYHSGCDLAHRLEDNVTYSASATRLIMAELLTAVEALHKRRIIHHNLKMDNVLMDDNGHIAITNFGSAVKFGGESGSPKVEDTTPHVAGKPGFMAPEIFGEDCHSYPVDVWSMGVIAHVLIYGRMPYGIDCSQPTEEIYKRLAYTPLKFEQYGTPFRAAEDLLRRMLEKNPRNRATIAELKAHPYFDGITWDAISRRGYNDYHRQKIYRFASPHLMNHSDLYPAGDAYRPGDVPFPWFQFLKDKTEDGLEPHQSLRLFCDQYYSTLFIPGFPSRTVGGGKNNRPGALGFEFSVESDSGRDNRKALYSRKVPVLPADG